VFIGVTKVRGLLKFFVGAMLSKVIVIISTIYNLASKLAAIEGTNSDFAINTHLTIFAFCFS
jgi:hypothetical protein